jgi:glutaconate CoA-transferase subunit A
VAVPSLDLDVALVHANRADQRGNAQFLGPDAYFDDLFCMAAARAFVSCEQIVEQLGGAPQTMRLNRSMVSGVVEAPHGAHFTSCEPNYARDEKFQERYARTGASAADWESFAEMFLSRDEAHYLKMVQVIQGSLS